MKILAVLMFCGLFAGCSSEPTKEVVVPLESEPVEAMPAVVEIGEYDDSTLRPWELSKPTFSWDRRSDSYTVAPAYDGKGWYKSAPLVEHRYVEVHFSEGVSRVEAEKIGVEIWRHFAADVVERHPQAEYKRVCVFMYVPGQEYTDTVAGRVVNEAVPHFPEVPEIDWQEFNLPSGF